MARILLIETATRACSVALGEDGKPVAAREEVSDQYIHAEKLQQFIGDVFQMAEWEPGSIDAVAVSSGPGSYTGLRIGVSTAKGVCYGFNIPLIAISTLTAITWEAIRRRPEGDFLFAPMMDARRMEVYTSLYNRELLEIKAMKPLVIEKQDDFSLTQPTFYFGDGAEKLQPVLIDNPDLQLIPAILPSARFMAAIADRLFENKKFEDLAYFEPRYGKEFKAIKSKKQIW